MELKGKVLVNDLVWQMADIFKSAQLTKATHQKNFLGLRKIFKESTFDTFWEAFLFPLYRILKTDIKMKSLFVDRVIDFLGTFLAIIYNYEDEGQEEHLLFNRAFEYLLTACRCDDDTIRYRACQIITNLMEHLVGVEISDKLCEAVENVFLQTLYDTKTPIRLLAVRILYRLQDPQDPENTIHAEFLKLIKGDGQPKVRELCVEKIILNQSVIEQIIKRTRDVDVNVRIAAFKRLANVVKRLKISDRRTLLISGMFDLSEKVQKCINSTFLSTWMECFDFNIFDLMEAVRFDSDEKDIKETVNLYKHILTKFYFKTRNVQEVLKILELNAQKLLPYEQLTWETVSFWRLFVEFLKDNGKLDEEIENVLPEVAYFFCYVKEFLESDYTDNFIEKQFIIKQLFQMIKMYDYADPPTRQSLISLIDYSLKYFDLLDDVIEEIIDCLKFTTPQIEARSRLVCEIIADLLCPIDTAQAVEIENKAQLEIAKLKMQLITLNDEQNEAVNRKDYLKADRIKQDINSASAGLEQIKQDLMNVTNEEIKKKTDLPTITKCLDIAFAILRKLGVSSLTESLRALKTDVIEDFLKYNNDIVRTKALRCYAICCIFDKSTALNGIHMFALPISAYQAGEECDMQTLMVCIGTVVDLIRIYGADLMAEPDEENLSDSVNEEHQMIFSGGTSLTQLIQGLVDLMDDSQYEVQELAGKGLCQLILHERVHSASLLCKLILKWCNPANNDEPESEPLRQTIAYTLGKVPYLPRCAEQLQDAFLLTIRILASAPKTSPLSEVDIDNIVKFMLALCNTSTMGPTIQSNISKSLCNLMMIKPNSQLNLTYSKILLMLNIPNDMVLQEDLLDMCDTIIEDTTVKKILQNLTKYRANIMLKLTRGDIPKSTKETTIKAEEKDEEIDSDF